ncbi:hypothetical protein DACRYDRAFT_114052 [Dacryopinax primogenitus]|uniref:Zinc finger PHD-type domain-containing protein n=1 Tax=Dacryopinax primogenitus (strain DJM 731) TaxID=1858805 RepID=M5GG15_DACPD|nr:uncharacterized protein DACRYDRAFT_114052 [Dacryopinax primogenitus]EJU04698.1 hypothetical protein DACRYDRAFT_114052 [Dacryopinax primogenitus]
MPTLRAHPPPPLPPAEHAHGHHTPAPLLFDPVPLPSQAVLQLRKDWKFAGVCQFIFTFEEALQLGEFETEDFEDDLTLGTHKIINKMMHKLLTILTYDRRITEDDWERFLRHQYERREPEILLLGTEEEPVEWSELTPGQRIEAVHSVTDWLFINPHNIRKKMKDEESAYLWRVEPIGYDAKKNAYWLFDDNRLWIQRTPPKPKVSHKKKEKPAQPPAKKQKLSASTSKAKTPAKSSTPAPAAPRGKQAETPQPSGRYPKRASAVKPPPPSPSKSPLRPRAMGIRQSSRLRGKVEDEVWQEIPEEWLKESDTSVDSVHLEKEVVNGNGTGRKRPLEEDGPEEDTDSDLTDLSDEEDQDQGKQEKREKDGDVEMNDVCNENQNVKDEPQHEQANMSAASSSLSSLPVTPPPPPRTINGVVVPADFVEWETIAVTLFQWEHVAERFEKSTNRDEKAFHASLVEEVVPRVLKELREIERLKRKEELMATRKRSSRLQMKELEAETRRLEEQKRAEDEFANARNKRAEEREKRQEAERLEKEKKMLEREQRALKRDMWQPPEDATPNQASGDEAKLDVEETSSAAEEAKEGQKPRVPKAEEKWELDCEICGKKGWNVDDGKKMACCETCGKWQHTACHDAADLKAGKQKRRWAQVTFKCKECRNKHRRELYAKRQEVKKAEEEKAALAAPAGQPRANGDLKVHLTIPKTPVAPPKVPPVNGVTQPSQGNAKRPASAPRTQTSPKVPTTNGYAGLIGQSTPQNHSAIQPAARPPHLPVDHRTSASHSPPIPPQPFNGYNPAVGQYPPGYPGRYNTFSPSMGYPTTNSGSHSPHTPHAAQAPPPAQSSVPHSSPNQQHSPNSQQTFQFPYSPGYGSPGYAYGFSRGPPNTFASQEQQQQYYQQYYQAYGADPRYAAYAAAYQPTKQPYAVPPAGANASSPTSAPVQITPATNGRLSPSAARPPVTSIASAQSIQPSHTPTPVPSAATGPQQTAQTPIQVQPLPVPVSAPQSGGSV